MLIQIHIDYILINQLHHLKLAITFFSIGINIKKTTCHYITCIWRKKHHIAPAAEKHYHHKTWPKPILQPCLNANETRSQETEFYFFLYQNPKGGFHKNRCFHSVLYNRSIISWVQHTFSLKQLYYFASGKWQILFSLIFHMNRLLETVR